MLCLEPIIIFCLICKVSSQTFPLTCNRDEDYPAALINHSKLCFFNIDAVSEVPEMVLRHGYKLETHEVVTVDGYILTMFRISPKEKPNGKTVVLQPGTVSKSGVYTDKGQQSHAFFFANAGYDVWLSNVRGMAYSYKHLHLTASDEKYWEFNLDQMALIDLRTEINFVSNYTNSTSIIYLGHSMGSTLGVMYASAFPEESKQLLSGIVMLAPLVHLQDNKFIGLGGIVIDFVLTFYRGGLFYGIEKLVSTLLQLVCSFVPWLCRAFVDIFSGKTQLIPAEYLMLFFNTLPTGLSLYMVKHYAQIHATQEFKKFDYGAVKNLQVYGAAKPPFYKLNGIKIPVHMYYGLSDAQVSEKDVKKAAKAIGSSVKSLRAITPAVNLSFGHEDFVYSKNLTEFLLVKILHDIESH